MSYISPAGGTGLTRAARAQLSANDLLVDVTDMPLISTSAGTILVAATQYFTRLMLPSDGLVVTNIELWLQTVGATLTHSYAALYKSDGTMLSQSADQSSGGSNWSSGTLRKTVPLSAQQTVLPVSTNDFVWAMVYVGTAVTAPIFRGLSVATNIANGIVSASRLKFGTLALADTAVMPNVTPGNMVGATIQNWAGLS